MPHRVPKSVLWFNVAYLGASFVAAAVLANGEFLFYCVVSLILLGIGYVAHRRVGFTRLTLWCLSGWGLFHMLGGLVPIPTGRWADSARATPTLYNLWLIPGALRYDHIMHAFGFGVMTYVSYQGLNAIAGRRGAGVFPTAGVLLLCVMSSLGFGATNELVEFAATLMMESTGVGDFNNLGFDLVANTAGAVAVAVMIRLTHQRSRGPLKT